MKIIYYVHGTTYDNELNICSGWKQVELNEKGKHQAENLGTITPYKFDVLFISDLIRTEQTAKLAFPSISYIKDKRLRECNYGVYDGKDKNFINYNEHIDIPFENGESLKDVEKRIRNFIEFVCKNYEGKIIGIIAHRATQLAFEVISKNITWEEAIKNDWRKNGNWQAGWEYDL